jgi:hypothetical protein
MRRALTAFFFLFSLYLSAQRIAAFQAQNVKGVVALRFTISPGPTCNGYSILRSTDSVNYIPIYSTGEICGNYNAPESKAYDDASPAQNQANFYRVQLMPYELSEIRRVFVSAKPMRLLTPYPNPLLKTDGNLNLRLYGVENVHAEGFLYNQSGNRLRALDLTTKGEHASLYVGDLDEGVYVIWLTEGTQAFSCKFAIYR